MKILKASRLVALVSAVALLAVTYHPVNAYRGDWTNVSDPDMTQLCDLIMSAKSCYDGKWTGLGDAHKKLEELKKAGKIKKGCPPEVTGPDGQKKPSGVKGEACKENGIIINKEAFPEEGKMLTEWWKKFYGLVFLEEGYHAYQFSRDTKGVEQALTKAELERLKALHDKLANGQGLTDAEKAELSMLDIKLKTFGGWVAKWEMEVAVKHYEYGKGNCPMGPHGNPKPVPCVMMENAQKRFNEYKKTLCEVINYLKSLATTFPNHPDKAKWEEHAMLLDDCKTKMKDKVPA